MKRIHIPSQLIILLIIVVSAITFVFDILEFYRMNIQSWEFIHEALSISNIFFFYLYLRNKPIFTETNVQVNLKNFLKLIALLYVVVIVLRFALTPEFSQAVFPQQPESISSLIYANLVSLAALLLLLPMVIIIKNLIYYKHKKRTNIYAIIAIVAASICIVVTVILQTPLNLDFEGAGIYNNTAFAVALVFLFTLATRNNWIIYLSRKEKYYYFLVSAALVWVIMYVFEYAFESAVPAHSLALGVFINIVWLFFVFYSILACLNLLLQLPTARVFDRKMKEVSSLHNLSRTISVEFDFEKLVRMVTEMSSEVIESSSTWLEIYDEKSQQMRVVASTNLSSEEITALNNRQNHEISETIFSTKKTLVINDLAKQTPYRAIRLWKKNLGSFAGVPLTGANGQVFGILFAAKSESFGFDPDDVNMMEAYANQASIALENSELLKKSFERERMEKELQIAREVQLRLLPQKNPEIKNIQIETLTITAYEVGGDYYDFYGQSNSGLGLIIGDVSGKGTSAAFYMAEAKGIIQSLSQDHKSPKDILIHTNKILHSSLEKKSFISILAARLDLQKKVVQFARAGHCPVIHYSSKTELTSIHQPEGIAVGLDGGPIFDKKLDECELDLNTNDILALYTDGLSEARNEADQEFGEERLCETIKSNAHLNVKELKEVIIDEILHFLDGQNLHDDLTLILIKLDEA